MGNPDSLFYFYYFLGRLYTQRGAQTSDPDIEGHMLYGLSLPGAPLLLIV